MPETVGTLILVAAKATGTARGAIPTTNPILLSDRWRPGRTTRFSVKRALSTPRADCGSTATVRYSRPRMLLRSADCTPLEMSRQDRYPMSMPDWEAHLDRLLRLHIRRHATWHRRRPWNRMPITKDQAQASRHRAL